jgi:integrase
LSLLYATGLRPAEAVALELADLDPVTGQLRVRRGKGRKPRPVSLPASALPALQDWLQVRGNDPGLSSAPCSRTDGWSANRTGGCRA